MVGNVIWLTGLENYQIDNKSLQLLGKGEGKEFSKYLSENEDGEKFLNHDFLIMFYNYLRDTYEDCSEVLK